MVYKCCIRIENFHDAILGYHLTLIFPSFFFRYFRRKIVLLRHRAVVAYGCLLSGLHDICNMFMQVADKYNVLILRKSNEDCKTLFITKELYQTSFEALVWLFLLIYTICSKNNGCTFYMGGKCQRQTGAC